MTHQTRIPIQRPPIQDRGESGAGSASGRGTSRASIAARLLTADATAPSPATTLHRETLVQASLDETFAFFADAENLERITPPWLNFSIRTATPLTMEAGLEIEYRLRLRGVPLPWVSRIDVWEPGVRFVDRQLVGPYRWWHHEHRFEASGTGTRVIDHVTYMPRFRWLSAAIVRRELQQVFDYRQDTLRRAFG